MRARYGWFAVLISACTAASRGDVGAASTGQPPALDGGVGNAPPDSPRDSSPPNDAPTTTGVFVATGLVGRTIASFDDGMSWTDDTSDALGMIFGARTCGRPASKTCLGASTAQGRRRSGSPA